MTNQAPFHGDQVGSLLRTDRIKEARVALAAGTITQAELCQVEDQEIQLLVAKQKEIGLQAVTDGEFRRSWWHFDFLEGLDGVEGGEAQQGIQFNQVATKSRTIKVAGPIDFTTHPFIADFEFLQAAAGETVAKQTIPSPAMLHYRGIIEYQPYVADRSLFEADLITAYQKAIQAFYDAGCRYLQLDDTSWSYLCSEKERAGLQERGLNPDELPRFYQRLINESLKNKPADLVVTMHICRGNFRSTWISSGGYEPVAEILFGGVNVNGFFLEYDDDRSGDFEPLRFVKRQDLKIVLGLVTSKRPELESEANLIARIQEASQYVPLENLCLSPQCGFASTEEGNRLTEAEQWEKLKLVLKVAKKVWG